MMTGLGLAMAAPLGTGIQKFAEYDDAIRQVCEVHTGRTEEKGRPSQLPFAWSRCRHDLDDPEAIHWPTLARMTSRPGSPF